MIEGFEDITQALTADELKLADEFVIGLRKRQGEIMAISAAQIMLAYRNRGVKLDGARVRKIINHIRSHGLVRNLVASHKGYYVENDPKRLAAYVQSLKQRATAILAVARTYDPLYQQKNLFNKQ